MARIRRSDQVIVLTGKDKGKRSIVLKVFDNDHLLVEGVNRVKKLQ
jgi:large subunit ribosomal protein L24